MNTRTVKIIAIFMVILLMAGCSAKDKTGQASSEEKRDLNWYYIEFDGRSLSCAKGEYGDIPPLQEEEHIQSAERYTGDVVPDEIAAVEIATSIKDNTSLKDRIQNWSPAMVMYDEDDAFWVVYFHPESDHDPHKTSITGISFVVTIQKTDGKVLYMGFM